MNVWHLIHPKLFFLWIFISLGCEEKTEQPKLSSIEIESTRGDRIELRETTVLSIKGFDQNNNPIIITETTNWSVDNNNVSIDQNGVVTALDVGLSKITATISAVSKSFTLEVWDNSAPRLEIYVSDAGNFANPPWQILKYDEDGGRPSVFINSNLSWPQDILFLEDQGIVLISNLNTGSIAKFDINTGAYIGNFATDISQPTRMKIGKDNLLYVLQWSGNGKVLRYQLDGTFKDEFTSTKVPQSIGLEWDGHGNLYVSSFNNGSGGFIRKFNSDGEDMGIFASSPLQGPTNIWFDSNSNLMVIDYQFGVIRRFDQNGVFIDNPITGLSQPEGVDFPDNGHFLIGNGGTGAVKEYLPNGTFVKDIVAAKSGGLIRPNAVVLRRVNY